MSARKRWIAAGAAAAMGMGGLTLANAPFASAAELTPATTEAGLRDAIDTANGNAEAEAILVSIIQLGKALGMTIVAEGIETQAEFDALAALGVEFGQGYFLGKPMSFKLARELLRRVGTRPSRR